MKYMLLIYASETEYTYPERAECFHESMELARTLDQEGKFISTAPLQPIANATVVKVRDGRRLVTDGPFAETREQLGGYFMIEAANLDDAIAIAGRIPGARRGTVEIRPVLEIPGLAELNAK